MGKFDNIFSSKVDTSRVVKFPLSKEITAPVQENILETALDSLKDFYRKETDDWIDEPVLADDTNEVIFGGKKMEILYQYDPSKQNLFIENTKVIDRSMWAVKFAINHLRKDLFLYEKGQVPLPSPLSVTQPQMAVQQERKENIFSRISNKLVPHQENRESPYYKQELQMHEYEITPDKWVTWKQYHDTAVAHKNAISWSSETTREGMENMRKLLGDFLDYWLSPRILTLYHYAIEIQISRAEDKATEISMALAVGQYRQEQQNPLGMPK